MRGIVQGLFVSVALTCLPGLALAGWKVYESEDQLLELGMRLQPRLEYDRVAVGARSDMQHDFIVQRARLKANGKIKKGSFGFEWKIDGTDGKGLVVPAAQVENAWIQYALGHGLDVKAGLYDQPFSRDRLTSDSRQLAVDRGDVSGVPNALGLADNATGIELIGKAAAGKAVYTVGLFDNRTVPGRFQDMPMVIGRLDINLGSTRDIYQDAHFGTDKWYCLGVNGSYQTFEGDLGSDTTSYSAGGVDGMIDVPLGAGRLLVRGEANAVKIDPTGSGADNDTKTWMVGAGYLMFSQRVQPFIRFDETRPDVPANTIRDVTFVGVNLYQKGHSLKIQGDVRFQANTNQSVDGARLQAQIDF